MWITRDELPTFLLMTTITITEIDLDLRKNGQRLLGKDKGPSPKSQALSPKPYSSTFCSLNSAACKLTLTSLRISSSSLAERLR